MDYSGSTPARGPTPVVPDYQLLRRIGGGAYGDVWLARSDATGILRAAKIVWRHRFEDSRPFHREFEGIQKFERISREHPSQLSLFHIGRNEAEGYFYYVMELADDLEKHKVESTKQKLETDSRQTPNTTPAAELYEPRTLRADLGVGRLPAARVLEIGLALAEALGHLHEHGLVHRDVKPSNVIFVNGRPKLADIGLVTDASDQCSIVGTEGYLPPEGPGTPQADIFALGKVLYEAATGMDRRDLPKLPEGLRSWPDEKLVFELNEIILKACASEPHSRFPSVERLLEELQALQGGKSIKRRRIAAWWWAAARRIGLPVAAVGAIAVTVAVLMRGYMPSGSRSDGPDSGNPRANGLCRQALAFIRNDEFEKFGEAYSKLRMAIDLDKHFARPYVGLLELGVRELHPKVRRMTLTNLQVYARDLNLLLPDSAPAYTAQTIIAFCDWDDAHFMRAEQLVRKAIAADDEYELAHTFYAYMLTRWGPYRADEARIQLARSEKILPLKAVIARTLGHTWFAERKYANALACYREALDRASHHYPAYVGIARVYQAQGNYTNAIASFRSSRSLLTTNEPQLVSRYNGLLSAYNEGQERGYWEYYLKETMKSNPKSEFYWKGVVQMHLGNTKSALGWLADSYNSHETSDGYEIPLTNLLFDECWDGLHENPLFIEFVEKLGFTKVMKDPKMARR